MFHLKIDIDLMKLSEKTRKQLAKAVEAAIAENATVSPTNAPPPQCGPGETCP